MSEPILNSGGGEYGDGWDMWIESIEMCAVLYYNNQIVVRVYKPF